MAFLSTSVMEVYYVEAPRVKKNSKKVYLSDIFYRIFPITQHKAKTYIIVDMKDFFILSNNII